MKEHGWTWCVLESFATDRQWWSFRGEGCGGLDGGKCLESGTNCTAADAQNIYEGSDVRKRICEREICIVSNLVFHHATFRCTFGHYNSTQRRPRYQHSGVAREGGHGGHAPKLLVNVFFSNKFSLLRSFSV